MPTELNRRFDSDPRSPSDPLFGRPGDQSFDNFWDQEKHDGAAEVFAHGFHVSSLKFYRGNSHRYFLVNDASAGRHPLNIAVLRLPRFFVMQRLVIRYPLFCGPSDNSIDNLWDQEEHDGAAEVFAHGFHVS